MEDIIPPIIKLSPIMLFLFEIIAKSLSTETIKRFFTQKDNQLKRLTLTHTEMTIKASIPAKIDNNFYKNLVSLKFTLKNTTKSDISKCSLVFAFDKNAIINNQVSQSQKNGKDFYIFDQHPGKSNEIVYEITNLNRAEHIDFEFDVADVNQQSPKFFATIPETGFKLELGTFSPTISNAISPISYEKNKLLFQ